MRCQGPASTHLRFTPAAWQRDGGIVLRRFAGHIDHSERLERARREVTVFELGAEAGAFAEHHEEQGHLRGRPVSAHTRRRRRRQLDRKRRKHRGLP